jgi:glycosyltransferase involved in cell wall biosynthesis
MSLKLSVLLPVYIKDDHRFLRRAIESITIQQTRIPNEVVIVKDGPISPDCNDVVQHFQANGHCEIAVVINERNLGLGVALQNGLLKCRYDVIVRMDADDIAIPNRCQRQIDLLTANNCSVVGSAIAEFDNDESIITGYRRLPVSHEEIAKYSKWRNPINHPSVAFFKNDVIAVGGYQDMKLFEDYYLWLRMLKAGMMFKNTEEVLLKMRAGPSQNARRSGFGYAGKEIKFLFKSAKLGLISKKCALLNCFVKMPIRILPIPILSIIYRNMLRQRR